MILLFLHFKNIYLGKQTQLILRSHYDSYSILVALCFISFNSSFKTYWNRNKFYNSKLLALKYYDQFNMFNFKRLFICVTLNIMDIQEMYNNNNKK